ncbi:DUF982 domain-containing protein [Ensifer sp. NPDC090286]|uniref:DUF982 domain-containing protein n=1 Tax=Ensifer sp. NPDC090286 TaxID=3363991 RepID=UPI00383A3C31
MTDLEVDRLWDEAVILDREEHVLRVQSTRDAYLCLKNHWPVEGGPAKAAALATCEAGLLACTTPDAARQAFIEAAREGGWTVRTWTEDEPS